MISVVTPTWRLGGFDILSEALARQEGTEFEWIIADALYRWRAPVVAAQLEALPFPVSHVPIENSLFPIMCPFRTRNSGVRVAGGDRVVFLTDYSVPPPGFLAAHSSLGDNTVGISPYIQMEVPGDAWKLPIAWQRWTADTTWGVISRIIQDAEFWSWSTLSVDWKTLRDLERRTVPGQSCALLGANQGMPPARFDVHWKSDSIPMDLLRQVNGFDESYDGHDWGDCDLTARLSFAGALFALVDLPLAVLDPHPVLYATVINYTQTNWIKLQTVQALHRNRCRHGLVYDDSVPLETVA